MQSIRGLFIGLRPANLPSLLSNALLAWVCVRGEGWAFSWSFLLILLLGFCFYAYGMWANDVQDIEWDKEHASQRPIPKGLVSVRTMHRAALAVLSLGLIIGVVQGASLWALALFLVIFSYTKLHKKTIWAIVLMGACRGIWLYLAGLSLAGFWGSYEFSWLLCCAALSLMCFTILISVLAREESLYRGRKELVCLLLSLMPLHDALWVLCMGAWREGLFCILCMCLAMFMQRRGLRAS